MTSLLQYTFFQNALAGIAIISIAAGIIGTYIMSRRMVSLCGGVTHACFGGLGLGYWLGVNPVLMAALFAVGSSASVEWIASKGRVREDSAIAVVWALGMAIGVLFVFLSPGYVPELNAFLFGNLLTITHGDLWAFAIYTVVLLVFFIANFRYIVACAFDRDFALVSGLPVRFINYAMTALVAVCIVLTIRLVGIMLLMSMLTLPQMVAENFSRRFGPMAVISAAVSVATGIGGLALASVIDVPCAAIIVLLQIAVYAASAAIRGLSSGR